MQTEKTTTLQKKKKKKGAMPLFGAVLPTRGLVKKPPTEASPDQSLPTNQPVSVLPVARNAAVAAQTPVRLQPPPMRARPPV